MNNLLVTLSNLNSNFNNLEELCNFISDTTVPNENRIGTLTILLVIEVGLPADTILSVLECLEDLGLIVLPSGGDHPNH